MFRKDEGKKEESEKDSRVNIDSDDESSESENSDDEKRNAESSDKDNSVDEEISYRGINKDKIQESLDDRRCKNSKNQKTRSQKKETKIITSERAFRKYWFDCVVVTTGTFEKFHVPIEYGFDNWK